MTEEPVSFRSISDLNNLSKSLLRDLIKGSSGISKLIKHQVSLLELYSHESKKLERIGYCDYELAYVCYTLALSLYTNSEKLLSEKTVDFVRSIKQNIVIRKESYETIKSFLDNSENRSDVNLQKLNSSDGGDPLLQRFQSLQVGSESSASVGHVEANSKSSVDNFKYRETIFVEELHSLINSAPSSKILLIDYRASKDFNYNHIKHSEIVNIEPSHINAIFSQNKDVTDQDLEERLKLHLSQDQFHKFQNRYKYDLVVIYNLKYGTHMSHVDRLAYLSEVLLNEDSSALPTRNPFNSLVELIMFKNKYISSKLKRHPCYLAGGVFHWHSVYGDECLSRTIQPQVLARPEASLSRGSSPNSSRRSSYTGTSYGNSSSIGRTSSPYLKNFGEYLSTAKSTDETPISNAFVPIMPSVSMSKYNPSSAIKSSSSSTTTTTTTTTISPPIQQPPTVRRALSVTIPNNTSASSITTSLSKEKPTFESVSGIATNNTPSKFLDSYVTGLVNLGNSCYMNCILQCLGATPPLTKFFFPGISNSLPSSSQVQSYRQHINVNNKLGSKGIMTTNFFGLLANMFNSNGKSFSPTNFKKVMGSLSPGGQFATFDQQDCLEFLTFVLDGLHEDLNQMVISDSEEKRAISELTPEQEKTREILPVRLASTIEWERYLKLNFSIIVDYFQGQHLSQLKCLECGTTSTTYNAFSVLSLPIPEKLGYSSNQRVSLDDCLKEFTTTELLDDNNKWHCPHCKRFTKSTKKITITRLPQILIIHFKRFKMTPNGYFNKLDTFVDFPVKDTLDLTSYWPDVGTSVNSNLKDSDIMNKEKEEQILSTLPTRNQQRPFRYKLYGVANHFGNLTTGHYTSYIHKEGESKKTRGWIYFDDAKLTYNCKESDVMNKNAYCLFYQRI